MKKFLKKLISSHMLPGIKSQSVIFHVSINIKPTVSISAIDGEIDYTTKEGSRILKEKADKYLDSQIEKVWD